MLLKPYELPQGLIGISVGRVGSLMIICSKILKFEQRGSLIIGMIRRKLIQTIKSCSI